LPDQISLDAHLVACLGFAARNVSNVVLFKSKMGDAPRNDACKRDKIVVAGKNKGCLHRRCVADAGWIRIRKTRCGAAVVSRDCAQAATGRVRASPVAATN
jgi:hypothetical protein